MLRLFGFPYSCSVERVELALARKQLVAERVWIDPDDRAEVLAASGQTRVPVLTDGDSVVVGSMEILAHVEERQPEPRLFPADAFRASAVRAFVAWFDTVWKTAPLALYRATGEGMPIGDPSLAGHRAYLRDSRGVFEGLLSGGPFLFGELSAADCAAWPYLRHAKGSAPDDTDRFHRMLFAELALGDGFPRIDRWIERVRAIAPAERAERR